MTASQPLRQLYRLVRKKAKRVQSHLWLATLRARNAVARSKITGSAPVVVSLTTFGPRLGTVAYAIESIASGNRRPRRLILWLDDRDAYLRRPGSVRRLERRGLEVRLTSNYGPHTKYFPALSTVLSDGLPLVTADDDILYPRRWLARLLDAAAAHPEQVNCYRASVVTVQGERLAPYVTWPRCTDTVASVTRFATGVSGVFYPRSMLVALHEHGDAFMRSCPRADDLWLHWVALNTGVEVRQISARPRHFPYIPGTQDVGLVNDNVQGGSNDAQIANLYSAGDAATLVAAGAPAA